MHLECLYNGRKPDSGKTEGIFCYNEDAFKNHFIFESNINGTDILID